MKVRFGVGVGAGMNGATFAAVVDRCEAQGIDSLWLSELTYTESIDPFIGLSYALARTSRLKVGTSVSVLPGRHPVFVAKQLASLAALAPRRVLPAFGLRPARPNEVALYPVPAGRRAHVFDESLQLLRMLLTQDRVDFAGEFFSVEDARIAPLPSAPLDIWLGGSAPAGLRRVGQYADGWLGSFLTPTQAGAAVQSINDAARDNGRTIESDHFGISIALAENGVPAASMAAARARNPDADPAELVATSWAHLHHLIDGYIAAGLSKFVVRPTEGSIEHFLDQFAEELIPRQN